MEMTRWRGCVVCRCVAMLLLRTACLRLRTKAWTKRKGISPPCEKTLTRCRYPHTVLYRNSKAWPHPITGLDGIVKGLFGTQEGF